MGNKKVSIFAAIKERINLCMANNIKVCKNELLNNKPWGRNVETFYILNLYKLGYLKGESLNCSGDKEYTVLKAIPDNYNSQSLRKEMKEKNF